MKMFAKILVPLENINKHEFAIWMKILLNKCLPKILRKIRRRYPNTLVKKIKIKFFKKSSDLVAFNPVLPRHIKAYNPPLAIPGSRGRGKHAKRAIIFKKSIPFFCKKIFCWFGINNSLPNESSQALFDIFFLFVVKDKRVHCFCAYFPDIRK